MSETTRILVVDDEPSIRELLVQTLRLVGFEVSAAGSGREAVDVAARTAPALVVLDVMLPDLDGFETARRLRGSGRDVPIVFLTARDAVEDRITGLTAGGDDYVTKPFSLEELVLRIKAVLRRVSGGGVAGERLRCGDLVLDEDSHEAWRGDRPIELSPTEFKLLRYLMENAGRVVSKGQILDRVWKYDFSGDSRIVETYVYYLRKKIDLTGPPLIHTVRGVGYRLREAR
ncbi:two-component system OmpR family response regulator [Actinocorallia herbida]|uniref:Two-component system OmpR family response regulator n=1 Tax=Actinocorallia herbida TaxID=58109 RepID=A0A3N1CZK5_9ACTN|nr:response regulator transcription factor [Actinocorallia herbida]ROO86705.1 two-component system OmpR family response regulator [Actinocorallia herbida]